MWDIPWGELFLGSQSILPYTQKGQRNPFKSAFLSIVYQYDREKQKEVHTGHLHLGR